MHLERAALPGIGMRHVFTTERGRRIGIISHRGGRHDLLIYDRDDPDSADLVVLNAEEAGTLAELLDTGHAAERIAELNRQVEGLVSAQIPIGPGSRYAGRQLGETRARTRTGASIVAVVRDRDVAVSPRPDFVFDPGDIVVVIGTAEGTQAVATILGDG